MKGIINLKKLENRKYFHLLFNLNDFISLKTWLYYFIFNLSNFNVNIKIP